MTPPTQRFRRPVVLLAAVAAFALLAPGALGHAGAAETSPAQQPLTEALQDHGPTEAPTLTDAQKADLVPRCLPSCTAYGNRRGMVPPATVVQNGSTVTWTVTPVDADPHTATSPDVALDEFYGPYSGDGKATFEVRADGLYVRSETAQEPTWRQASAATELPDGTALLPYKCNFHTDFQRGVLLVTSASADGSS